MRKTCEEGKTGYLYPVQRRQNVEKTIIAHLGSRLSFEESQEAQAVVNSDNHDLPVTCQH